MPEPSPRVRGLVADAINDPTFSGAISASLIAEIAAETQGDTLAALRLLAPTAASFAHVPVSGYRVGVVALGRSGRAYLGANLELAGAPLYLAVHAEQSAVSLAMNHGEERLEALVVEVPPCAHCRQFLLELGDPAGFTVVTAGRKMTLASLIPDPFGPIALGSEDRAFDTHDVGDTQDAHDDPLVAESVLAAHRSHSPYTNSPAGVAVELRDGTVVAGSYVESVAFNPSLDPVRAALGGAHVRGWPTNGIARLVLAHRPTDSVRHKRVAETATAWLPEQPEVEVHELVEP